MSPRTTARFFRWSLVPPGSRVAEFGNRFAREDASPAGLDSADGTAIYVDARVANPHLPTSGGTALLGVTLRGVPRTVRAPADLVVVVDVSGSMNEAGKITAVRHALARMVETLDPADHIAIVTFSDGAHIALPMTSVGAARDVVLGAIGTLSANGGTNLHAGLVAGGSLARMTGSHNTRLLLLSDGMATVGETSHEGILASVAHLTGAHVPITTIGVGSAIDFALLERIAREHGGAFHFVDQPAEVERVFATYGRSLSEVSARSVEVRVEAPRGSRITRVFDDHARLLGGGLAASIPVGDLGGSDVHVALVELELPAGFHPSEIPVDVSFRTIDGAEEHMLSRPASFGYDGVGAYALVDEREPGLYRAATMGFAALGLREAALAEERGDLPAAAGWLGSTLTAVEAAQRHLESFDATRAATLSEPLGLLRRAHVSVSARVPPSNVATNTTRTGTSAPVVVLYPSPQVITPAPGVTLVPTTVAVGAPPPTVIVTPSSAAFAGWR